MKSTVLPIIFLFALAFFAQSENSAPECTTITNGAYTSYCVYQNNKIRFVFLAKNEFTSIKGAEPESGVLRFPKKRSPEVHEIKFSLLSPAGDLLALSVPGNLTFHYDLTRGRVFFVDFDIHGFAPIIRQIPVKLEPITSADLLTKGSEEVSEWLSAADESKKWEQTRVQVPEQEYKKGRAAEEQSIIWGQADESGLRLGIGGLRENGEIQVGQNLPIKQYIRNDGPETLRLSPTGFFNEGIEGKLTSLAGVKHSLNRGYKWPMFLIRIKLEPGQIAELQSSPLQTILVNNDGTPGTSLRAFASGFVIPPGDYTLSLTHHVGEFIGKPVNASEGDPRLAPGLGEWIGSLQASPILLHITGPSIGTGEPGTVLEMNRLHRIQFQKGQIVLSHRAGGMTGTGSWVVDAQGNWPVIGGTWKIVDPSGDYRAAWDAGSTRFWYVDDTGIQRLDIGEHFVDAGHWTMDEATGDLANMPAGVRQALNLPAK